MELNIKDKVQQNFYMGICKRYLKNTQYGR